MVNSPFPCVAERSAALNPNMLFRGTLKFIFEHFISPLQTIVQRNLKIHICNFLPSSNIYHLSFQCEPVIPPILASYDSGPKNTSINWNKCMPHYKMAKSANFWTEHPILCIFFSTQSARPNLGIGTLKTCLCTCYLAKWPNMLTSEPTVWSR